MKPGRKKTGQIRPDGCEGSSNGRHGLFCVILSTDHQKIGTFYFVLSALGGMVGVVLSLLLRIKLDTAGFYGVAGGAQLLPLFSSAHGLVMIFLMMIPALFGGFGTWLVPLMTGAGELAFPRVSRAAFWLFFLAFVLFMAVLPVVPASFYPVLWLLAAIHVAVAAAVLLAVNFIVTIITMRVPAVKFTNMPPFVWSILVASFLLLMCLPVMAAAASLFLGGHVFALSKQVFFDVPRLQVMLWFFSHPEIYVLLLPAFGIISHIVMAFSKVPLYAEKGAAAAMALIGLAGFVLWTQNVFRDNGQMIDMATYLLFSLPVIGLPAMFIIASWGLTVVRGGVRWQTPMLWAGGFLFTLVMGAVSAFHLTWVQAFSGARIVSVAHFHYILSLGAVFALFAGWYFWFPKMSGVRIRIFTGKLHFWVMFFAVNMIFLPQYFLGFDYAPESAAATVAAFVGWARLATVGTVVGVFSVGIFVYGVVEALIRGEPAGDNPWGEGAATLEWQLSSPPQKTPPYFGLIIEGE